MGSSTGTVTVRLKGPSCVQVNKSADTVCPDRVGELKVQSCGGVAIKVLPAVGMGAPPILAKKPLFGLTTAPLLGVTVMTWWWQ